MTFVLQPNDVLNHSFVGVYMEVRQHCPAEILTSSPTSRRNKSVVTNICALYTRFCLHSQQRHIILETRPNEDPVIPLHFCTHSDTFRYDSCRSCAVSDTLRTRSLAIVGTAAVEPCHAAKPRSKPQASPCQLTTSAPPLQVGHGG